MALSGEFQGLLNPLPEMFCLLLKKQTKQTICMYFEKTNSLCVIYSLTVHYIKLVMTSEFSPIGLIFYPKGFRVSYDI